MNLFGHNARIALELEWQNARLGQNWRLLACCISFESPWSAETKFYTLCDQALATWTTDQMILVGHHVQRLDQKDKNAVALRPLAQNDHVWYPQISREVVRDFRIKLGVWFSKCDRVTKNRPQFADNGHCWETIARDILLETP